MVLSVLVKNKNKNREREKGTLRLGRVASLNWVNKEDGIEMVRFD